MAKLLTRAEVPIEQTWNLADLFPTVADWEAALNNVAESIGTVTKFKGTFAQGPAQLAACLTAQEALQIKFQRVAQYASFNQSTDATNPANQAAAGRVGALSARLGSETAFVRSEILALPEGTIERYLAEAPELASFRRLLEKMLAEKAHMLSPETERALAALGEVLSAPEMIYERSKASDMRFDPIIDKDGNELPMSFAGYEGRYERSADVDIRHKAWASFNKSLNAYKNTYAATWATEVKKNVVLAKLRGYESATHMLLALQEVTVDVYNQIHDVILPELAPHMRKYAELRKKVLGLDKLLYPDIEAPLDPDFNPPTTFAEAAAVIKRGLAVLGPEYGEIMEKGLSSRWIDWAENIGKSTGAFCSTPYGVHPFILITWTATMRDALVLSHELGHGGNGVLTQRNQRQVNSRGSMFFTEAPSTINELIVGNKLMSESNDPRFRRWVIMQFLATYHHNFVRHLIEGELQRRIYKLAEKGQTITAMTLCKVQGEILREFWGDTVEIDDGACLTWMRQPHYYMGLYPYSYSAGLTVGTAVAQDIVEQGQPAIDRWLQVLKSGGTKKPLELAQMAGVDMSKPEPIRKAVAYVGRLVDELVRSF